MGRPYVHRLRVRYGECDPQGIVFNAHYLGFFDVALTELWRAALPGGYRAMTEGGVDLVVAEATCRYLASAGFDDELDIAVSVAHLGRTSLRTHFRVTRDGVPVVEGEIRHVFVDLATRDKRPIPDAIRAGLEPFAVEPPPVIPDDVVHLRVVAPKDRSEQALAVLERSASVTNIVVLADAARRPVGDVILCDVAREDASVIVADLKELDLHERGSIAMEEIDIPISRAAREAEKSARGAPADAVVWEDVEQRTSEESRLTGTFLLFIVLAQLIAAVGIYLDTPILIVGAMVVGPEFGPIAGLCVAVVERRPPLALRSATALAVGFPAGITCVWIATVIFRATGLTPEHFSTADHHLASIISSPDFFAFFVAFCAGIAGMVSLSTAKSGALIGVLISVTTIPAAANVGVSFAYQDWPAWRGSMEQLAINLGTILLAGLITLSVQRRLYHRRRRRHAERVSPAGPRPRASS